MNTCHCILWKKSYDGRNKDCMNSLTKSEFYDDGVTT